MATDFDGDKTLKEFADELSNAGCSIKAIGSALRDQPEALKEKNWNAVAKKEELTSFVEIYTVVLSIVAYALKSKQISYKPSQNYMKALVMHLSEKLPQENDGPLLTQWDYMNNLHNIFHEIHESIYPTAIISDADVAMPKANSAVETNLASHFETSSQPTAGTTAAATAPSYVCKTWQVGTKCKTNDLPSIDGTNYSGATCVITGVYDEVFGGYFVRFDSDNKEVHVAADKLECIAMGSDIDSGTSGGFGFGESSTTETTDGGGGLHLDIDIDCSRVKEAAGDCMLAPLAFCANHAQLLCAFIIFIVMLVIASSIVHGGRMKVEDGKEYEESSTEERCLILSYERGKCEFECGTNGCSNYKSKYGDNVYDCDKDSGEDDCQSYDYLYTATAGEKCGSVELYSNDFDVGKSCNGKDPLEIGVEVDCYVLDCGQQEFTVHHSSAFADAGNGEIIGGSIFLGVVICGCLCWIACHIHDNS